MSGMGKARTTVARERARAAKAKVDAARAQRDAQIEELQTEWFVAVVDKEAAEEAARLAEMAMSEAAVRLLGIGLTVQEVAELCDSTAAEVRAHKKAAQDSSPAQPSEAALPERMTA